MGDDHLDWPDWVNQGETGPAPPRDPTSRTPPAEAPTAPHDAVPPAPPPRASAPRSTPGAVVPPARGTVPPSRGRAAPPQRGAPPPERGAQPPRPAVAGPSARAARRDLHKAERTRRRKRRVAVLVVLALLVLPFAAAAGWVWWQIDPLTSPGADVVVEVQRDWGVSQIADELSGEGVIGNAFVFKAYAKATGGGPFQAGTYDLQENMGARSAIAALEEGPRPAPRGKELALPPGLTVDEIAARVGEMPGLSAERFLEVADSGVVRSMYQRADQPSLEGLLYPDTYFINKSQDEEDVLRLLVQTFDEKATAAGIQNAPAAGLTPYEAVIVASLIQNETGIPEELPLVSAVIRNRLDDGQLLQIDYTLCYAKGGCPPAPTDADKDIDSPYNTYLYAGLPPTPISSVTAAMITAAVSPADVDYKFYVLTDQEGHHAFATTLEEHEANIRDAQARGVL